MATTPFSSQQVSANWDQKWLSKNSAALAPVVYQKMYKNYGKGAELFEMINMAERKIYVPNATITTFERQAPQAALKIRDAIAINNAGDDVTLILHADNFDANGNAPVRQNDALLLPAKYMAGNASRQYVVVTIGTTTVTNDTLTLRPFSKNGNTIAGSQITTQIPAGTWISTPLGNYHTFGSGQPGSLTDGWATRSHKAPILKATTIIEGGTNAKDFYEPVAIDMGGGQQFVTSKAVLQAEFDLDSQIDAYLLLGEQNDNTTLTETSQSSGSQLIPSGFGVWQWADQLAQDFPYTQTFDYNDFYDIKKLQESQALVSNMSYFIMGSELGRYVEQSGLSFIKEYSGGSDLMDSVKNRLGVSINVARLGNVEYVFKEMASWSNPNKFGININDVYTYEFPEGGLIIPDERVNMKIQGAGEKYNNITLPNLTLAYVNNNGENRERIMQWEVGVNGLGLGGNFVANQYDLVKGYWLTQPMLIVGECNKWVKVRKK